MDDYENKFNNQNNIDYEDYQKINNNQNIYFIQMMFYSIIFNHLDTIYIKYVFCIQKN